MHRITSLLIAAIIAASCNNNSKDKEATTPPADIPKMDSTLVTDSSWGAITTTTDFAGLQQIFGSGNVKDERICGPECMDSLDVTFIHRDTDKEITVYWADSAYHKTIAFLETYNDKSPYHTSSGLKMGSTLNQLLNLNGKKINFSGFDWDYGGSIQSYNGGNLDKSNVGFQLGLAEYSDNSLSGDMELHTDMPAVKKALDSIRIYKIYLNLHKDPNHEH